SGGRADCAGRGGAARIRDRGAAAAAAGDPGAARHPGAQLPRHRGNHRRPGRHGDVAARACPPALDRHGRFGGVMTTDKLPASETDELRLLIHAYHDGELDPASMLAVERRLAADPALARESDAVAALRRAVQDKIVREEEPAALRARIERAV